MTVSSPFNSATVLTPGVQQYVAGDNGYTTLSPTGANQVIGNDGAGNIAVATLEAGDGVTIDNFVISSNSGATSGSTGITSPAQFITATLASDVALTTIYVSDTPTLAQMQTISQITITPFYANSNNVGSTTSIYACVPITCPIGSALGTQFALFSSTNTSSALYAPTPNSQGIATSSYDNASSVMLSFEVPSVVGVAVTYYLAATSTISPNVTILADGFNFFVAELLPSTPSIISTTEIVLPTSNIQSTAIYTGSSQTYGTTTPIVSQVFKKQYSNTQLVFVGALQMQALSANQQYYGIYGLYVSPTSASLSSALPYDLIQNSGKGGTGSLTGKSAFLGSQGVIDFMIGDASVGAGNFNIAIGSTYKGAAYQYTSAGSSLYVQEVQASASSGYLQNYAFPNGSTTTTPYVNSLSPQYSQGTLISTWTVDNKASGSALYFSGTIGNGGTTGSVEGQLCFNFYTSNSPTATPFTTRRVTAPQSAASTQNTTFIDFCIELTAGSAYTPLTIYVTVTSLTSGQTTQNAQLTANFREVYPASIATAGVSSVTAASGSYLTASTVNGAVTVGSQQANTTQAGLVALAAAVTSNLILRVNSVGAIVASKTPQYPSFGSSLFLYFNGSNAGQVTGNQIGEAVYQSSGTTVTVTVGSTAYLCYVVDCIITLNITTTGTFAATSVATVGPLPFTPIAGIYATPDYFGAQPISGITIPNGNTLCGGVVGGSNQLGLYLYDINSNTYPPAEYSIFAATNVGMRLKFTAYITTPPTT